MKRIKAVKAYVTLCDKGETSELAWYREDLSRNQMAAPVRVIREADYQLLLKSARAGAVKS